MSSQIMLLMKATSYRAPAFLEAAGRLNIEIIEVVDSPASLSGAAEKQVNLPFADSERALSQLVTVARERSVQAILAVDDSGSLLAARASAALGLPHNDPVAAEAARDKYRMRSLMTEAGVPVPWYRLFKTDDDLNQVARQVPYPCVVKPLRRTGSQGVIRADNQQQFIKAATRLARILHQDTDSYEASRYLVEQYIPGIEVALEGMLDEGRLQVLALFDKPDPLEGPYFEETIYVTPSRLPPASQKVIARRTAEAATALGLRRGPIHAELRLNEQGPWLLEVAGRSIGGLCSRILRFGVDTSLEELILRQAVSLPTESLQRQQGARGVMMIPIPAPGLLRGYDGVEQALSVPNIEEIEITAHLHNFLTPLPEGDSYLGFIFAQGDSPGSVEAALRESHACLRFEIEPVITLRQR